MAQPKKQVPLPFTYTFSFGAIAGVTELLLLYPLDVVKTRQQLEAGKGGMGMMATFKNIISTQGTSRLYKGIIPPLLMEAPKRAIKFSANGWWSGLITNNGQRETTQAIAILTGCAAGGTESFVVTPFELVKIRLQDKATAFKGPIDVLQHAIKNDGIFSLYKGMEATFWRHWWWSGGYFGTIYAIKGALPEPTSKKTELSNNLIAGTAGGFVGTAINTPFDVVKTRIQLNGAGEWTYPALLRLARDEGISGMYKGFAPKVLRLAPGGGVLLLVVELLSGMARKSLGPPYI